MRLYLDVDGVLVPFCSPPLLFDDWSDEKGIRLSRTMGAALCNLAVEVVWLTTWRDAANEHISPYFDWPALPVLDRKHEVMWWKLEALLRDHPADTPFVWIDDELDERRADLLWLIDNRLDALDVPYLLVSPSAHIGLTPGEIDLVARFVDEHRF